MTPDEHQRERMRHWSRVDAACESARLNSPEGRADNALAEFDKRFPAPAAVDEAREYINRSYTRGWNDGHISGFESAAELKAELATLREKARLWDAVASGKAALRQAVGDQWAAWYKDAKERACVTDAYPTAAEAVQAAIDAGALK